MTTDKDVIARATAVGVWGNVALVALKIVAGIVGHSGAMISDAVHSLSDVLATAIAYVGATISAAPADKGHPYGHEQFENLAAIAIGLILLFSGCAIGYSGLKTAFFRGDETLEIPTILPLAIAVVSIATKEWMYRYARRCALYLNSSAFMADAQHHRSDALSSVGALIGISCARLGWREADALAAAAISLFIIKSAFDVLKPCLSRAIDASCGDEFESRVAERILANPGVERLDLLRTRKFGARVYVEAEISVDGAKTLYAAHRIAHEVHNAVEKNFPTVKHVMIHVNPTQLNDDDGKIDAPSN